MSPWHYLETTFDESDEVMGGVELKKHCCWCRAAGGRGLGRCKHHGFRRKKTKKK